MRAFNVLLNGKKLCLAGVHETGVLSTMVVWTKRDGNEKLFMEVGGLAQEENRKWIKQRHLRVGDEIRIKIVQAKSVDKPIEITRTDPVERLKDAKRYVRVMAKELGWKIQTRPPRSAP